MAIVVRHDKQIKKIVSLQDFVLKLENYEY